MWIKRLWDTGLWWVGCYWGLKRVGRGYNLGGFFLILIDGYMANFLEYFRKLFSSVFWFIKVLAFFKDFGNYIISVFFDANKNNV